MYKVKTTAPKRYRVNPNAAEIEPGATVEVKGALPNPTPPPRRADADAPPAPAVLLLAMEQYPDPAKRRDRFLIQAAWADQTPAAELDVAERVTPTPPPPPATCPDSAPCCSTVAGAASVDGQGGQRHGLGRVQARECPDRPFSHQRVSHPGGRRRGIHTRLHASQRRARNPFSKPEYRALTYSSFLFCYNGCFAGSPRLERDEELEEDFRRLGIKNDSFAQNIQGFRLRFAYISSDS